MELINFDILRRPANWFIVATMLILGLFALHFGLHLIHGSPDSIPVEKHPSRFA